MDLDRTSSAYEQPVSLPLEPCLRLSSLTSLYTIQSTSPPIQDLEVYTQVSTRTKATMAWTSTSTASKKSATSEKASQMSQEKKAQEERNAAKRRHEYVPSDLQPKGRLLRIHTKEDVTWSMPGRIIKEWVECEKPATEPNRGCRTGRMGFWVETEEGFKAVLICKRKVCDWGAGEAGEEEHEMEGGEVEEGESDNPA